MDGRTERKADEWMDGQGNQREDGRMDELADGLEDGASELSNGCRLEAAKVRHKFYQSGKS